MKIEEVKETDCVNWDCKYNNAGTCSEPDCPIKQETLSKIVKKVIDK